MPNGDGEPIKPQDRFLKHCQLEDQLINNRLTWLLAFEGLLFAGYGGILKESQGTALAALTGTFATAGITVAALIGLGVLASVLANLHHWGDLNREDRKKFGDADRPKIRLGMRSYTTVIGWLVALIIPLVFILSWMELKEVGQNGKTSSKWTRVPEFHSAEGGSRA